MSGPMVHLTDDQLSARLDGATVAADAARLDAHLEQCEACRDRLAELSLLDRDLATALTHDPGEAYFASFADRVGERIASGSGGAAEKSSKPAGVPRGWFGALFGAPRRLAAIGGTLAVVVAAGLTWRMMQSDLKAPGLPAPSLLGSVSSEAPGPSERAAEKSAEQGLSMALESESAAPSAASDKAVMRDRREAGASDAAPAAPARNAAPGRMQEMRTQDNGEQVPVTRSTDRLAARDATPSPAASQQERIADLKKRSIAQPLSERVASEESRADGARKELPAELEAKSKPAASAPAAAPVPTLERQATPPSSFSRALTRQTSDKLTAPQLQEAGAMKPSFDEDDSARVHEDGSEWCGVVRDAEGRVIANATVTVVETGRSVRTDGEGSFCLPAARRAATLSVLAVGFEAARIRMSGEGGVQPLAIALKAVPVVGTGLSVPRAPGWRTKTIPSPLEAARWDSVAARAEESLGRSKGSASRATALRSVADARMRAWRAATTPARLTAARAAVTGYLEALPAGVAQAEAIRWRDELPR